MKKVAYGANVDVAERNKEWLLTNPNECPFQKGDYMAREICGECKYNKYSTTEKEFYCSNTDSDNYGIPTMYDDSCEDFEEKDD